MKSFVFALILAICSITGSAHAQTWYAEANKYPLQASDTAQLPFSVTFNWSAPAGWTTYPGATWEPVWPRNASGAWYRPLTYTQPSITKNPVFPYAYSCVVQGLGFKCRDIARGIDRMIGCPASISMTHMVLWRSHYNAAWRERGLFTANVGPFSSWQLKTINLTAAAVTAKGKQLNCMYGNNTINGAGTTLDAWIYRR